MTFVGIDVSKASLDVAALPVTGEAQWKKFENTSSGQAELLAWLGRFPGRRVALEATGSYHYGLTLCGSSWLVWLTASRGSPAP